MSYREFRALDEKMEEKGNNPMMILEILNHRGEVMSHLENGSEIDFKKTLKSGEWWLKDFNEFREDIKDIIKDQYFGDKISKLDQVDLASYLVLDKLIEGVIKSLSSVKDSPLKKLLTEANREKLSCLDNLNDNCNRVTPVKRGPVPPDQRTTLVNVRQIKPNSITSNNMNYTKKIVEMTQIENKNNAPLSDKQINEEKGNEPDNIDQSFGK